MGNIFVRPLRLYDDADKAAFVAAVEDSGKEFPKDLFTLPSTRIMVAEIENRIIMYQPQFLSMTLGSLVPVGSLTQREYASAQHQLVAVAFTRAHTEGLADVIAFSSSPATRAFALRHGFIAWGDGLRLGIR
jgi:hypothetical protein